jgi:hypothetical protein
MAFPEGIDSWKISAFTNAHENFSQPLDKDQSYDLFLDSPAIASLPPFEQYALCTRNIMWVIRDAIEKRLNVRAMGSGWSLSKVAVCDDCLINTKGLRLKFKLKEENFDPTFLKTNRAEDFRFVQCGNSVISINEYLEKKSDPAKCLRVSGGSNGQTIAGAFSTGTHGASLYVGALSEMVVGLHIVTGPDRHVYLERSSRKVTSAAFHKKIGAEVILDDALFNAALVSFGSFGVIHGVMIEVEDKFLLKQRLKRIPFDEALAKTLETNDFQYISHHLPFSLNDPDHRLYHFELAINPHDFAFNDPGKGAYMRTMFQTKFTHYDPIKAEEKYSYGDDTLGLIQSVLDAVEKTAGFLNRLLIPKLVNTLFNLAYDRPEEATGTIGETFNTTKFRGQLFSAAFGINAANTKRVVQHCLEVNKTIGLAGVMALRFLKGTQATLGFTRWEHSCVLELDGADAAINHQFMKVLADRLEAENIPYGLHWGKVNRILDRLRVQKMYGESTLTDWKKQRSRIMCGNVQQAFNNEFMTQLGLDEFVPYHPEGSPLV